MTTTPPLLKPRHADGRLMTEDEIRGLDGDALRCYVAVCISGYEWREWTGNVPGKYRRSGWKQVISAIRVAKYTPHLARCAPQWPIVKAHVYEIPCYESDIAAAFTVDRPDWRWEMEDYDRENLDLMVIAKSVNTQGAIYEQHLGRKATPADYARARCVAALLLAAKIGE